MNLILLGPPGAGKGTQAAWLREELGVTYVATGDLLRQHRADNTVLGREAAAYMDRGELVPDVLVVDMIMQRIVRDSEVGLLLDGFPRTVVQADTLHEALTAHGRELTAVLLIDTPDEVVEARISGRRQCGCGRVYHVEHNPPSRPGVCDEDGERLVQRDDDRAEIVRRRLAAYYRNTEPLVEYYEARGVLHRIDGTGAPSDVADKLRATLTSSPRL